MSEDDNEGVFGPPPPTGNADRISQQMLGRGPLRYDPTREHAARLGHLLQEGSFEESFE